MMQIFQQLSRKYPSSDVEEITFVAMWLLGRLPDSHFVFNYTEEAPRVACLFSDVWIVFAETHPEILIDNPEDPMGAKGEEPLFVVDLWDEDRSSYKSFNMVIVEDVVRCVKIHERRIRSGSSKRFVSYGDDIITHSIRSVRSDN